MPPLPNISYDKIQESRRFKLQSTTIDNELKFDEHNNNFCMTQKKLTVLVRMRKDLDLNKLELLFKPFFECKFKYCSLKWMFQSRSTNIKTNKLRKMIFEIRIC